MKIKICGMREPDNIRQVTDLHPDYMGFIFWSGSPRNACQLDPAALATVPQTIRRVGVFVNETEEQVIRTAQRYRLDLVQLHGHESPETCRRINRIVPVIKALSVATQTDLEQIQRYQDCCSILLLDTKTPHTAVRDNSSTGACSNTTPALSPSCSVEASDLKMPNGFSA